MPLEMVAIMARFHYEVASKAIVALMDSLALQNNELATMFAAKGIDVAFLRTVDAAERTKPRIHISMICFDLIE